MGTGTGYSGAEGRLGDWLRPTRFRVLLAGDHDRSDTCNPCL